MSGTPVPPLSRDARMAALVLAGEARSRRARALGDVKAGRLDPRELLASDDPVIRRTRARAFVESWPGFGRAKAARVLAAARVADGRRLGGLGRRQREALASMMPEFRRGE